MRAHADYLCDVMDPRRLQAAVSRLLCAMPPNINLIACSGISGMSVAFPLSATLGIPLAIVRKGEDCHSLYTVELGPVFGTPRYVIVDDCVASGRTVDRIMSALANANIPHSACAGIMLYSRFSGSYETVNGIDQIDASP